MRAAEDDPNLYGEEDEDDEDEDTEEDEEDEDEEDDDVVVAASASAAAAGAAVPLPPDPLNPQKRKAEDAVDDLNSPSPSTTSSSSDQNPNKAPIPPPSSAPLSAPPDPTPPSSSAPAAASPDNKRLKTTPVDDSRRLFQRLWTDEDEIGLLQGFLEYTSQRGRGRGVFHHDTAPFYDQIKTRLQLDFNKNQLVEKLRRLKKKYRNVVNRIGSGKDFSFKSPHEQATFEISRKIWSTAASAPVDEDEDGNSHPNAGGGGNKVPRSRRRGRKRLDDVAGGPPHPPPQSAAAMEDNMPNFPHSTPPSGAPAGAANPNVTNVVEDTVRSCLSPLFKELLYCAINGPCNSAVGGVALNPLPLNFGGNSVNLSSSEAVDERWRKQQILELEVYSKRLELVQEQIKSALEELRSMGS
ncbi:hypothetical protein MRB53_032103 [Persea americana]|uniref:Uncharacterized protein n=1 Tax=Persea americana TaxID=3435 RepID=A0ACC2KQU7_PERAE|nr:hypothetical protein MRB53_032103 [Persea americana]